ncbi:MAG: CinA family protein [Clostridia bacterium]|nr:CinA family protein [Clostridia bacterium]
MNENKLLLLAENVVKRLTMQQKTLAVAESCTGGWLSKLITDVSGASSVYKGGICSYSNEIKIKLLGVSEDTLRTDGAVSYSTAMQMAQGVRKAMDTDIGVGITGIAGPLSDNTSKPVGLIYVAVSYGDTIKVVDLHNTFTEDVRLNNRLSALETALNLLSSTGDF